MVTVARHHELLEKLGLHTLAGVRSFRGDLVKNHKGRRDISRIRVTDSGGFERVFYLKRSWKHYKKDGLASLLRHGKVWSISRVEWENCLALERSGLRVAAPVAFGEECGPFWEKFSFLITEAAAGRQTLDQFLREGGEPSERRRVFDALALEIRRLHDAGLASPDLFARHLFVDATAHPPQFCLIDMARLDREQSLSDLLRARDLAALNITAPTRFVSTKERVRFLRLYAGSRRKQLMRMVQRRMEHLLGRRKFRHFLEADSEIVPVASKR